ncbi:flagellar hook assembly protein FlgD [Moritella viscosa]|uniref:Basal-body rod modification protein FlgD n=1 Tax=Moritella viscosa TaxID=80854 RepID=A0ABY1HB71_9GAMM|nr:flagellar hook capping FlgD N-terminal domain-containing protein [Moritella viscosa]CED58790.1 flagellar basal-body rod protein FlgD [Moritella viscosa]SGY83708.1 LfgD [Moritella viscosa]SGY84394.1 LfgD [Moritella viscosa]SGY85243.1 LfgD [Moritella viscosa]SHN97876.1 LfgD [Moritella viscosa]
MNPINNINRTDPAQAADAKGSNALGLKNEFLDMMVAQIKNQDPLNPLDGTEYVGQLAQFSMVEGIEGLRASQAGQAEMLYTQQVLQSTALIGTEVLVPSTGIAAKQGEKPSGVIRIDSAAEEVTLSVKDLNGNVVDTQTWKYPESGDIEFAVSELDEGSYVFDVEVKVGDQVLKGAPLLSREVEKITLPKTGSDIQLSIAGMGSVSLFSISEFGKTAS